MFFAVTEVIMELREVINNVAGKDLCILGCNRAEDRLFSFNLREDILSGRVFTLPNPADVRTLVECSHAIHEDIMLLSYVSWRAYLNGKRVFWDKPWSGVSYPEEEYLTLGEWLSTQEKQQK
jgi:hypothetical protein